MDKENLKKQVEVEIWNLERLVKEMIEITDKIAGEFSGYYYKYRSCKFSY